MFLLCLFAAYLLVRLWEDTTATIRREPPPRHAYRMAKLAARGDAGRPVPTGAFRRYATGLLDDAWDSAHHRRQLMAEHRADKRARKAKAKIAKERAAWAREDGVVPDPVGFDAVAPEVAEATTAPSAPTAPATPGTAAPDTAAPGTSTSTSTDSEPATTSGSARLSPATASSLGFTWTAIAPAVNEVQPSAGRKPSGAATSALASDLSRRIDEVSSEATDKAYTDFAGRELTADQIEIARRWQDGLATGKAVWSMSGQEWMSLPLPVRADLLDEIRRHPNATIVSTPGQEDVEALAVLKQRYGGDLNPSDIYSALDDLQPAVREVIQQAQAERRARHPATNDDSASADSASTDAAGGEASSAPGGTATPEPEEPATSNTTNVIPFPSPHPNTSTSSTPAVAAATPTRLELPMTNSEITGLESAIAYAGEMEAFCQGNFDQISNAVPTSDKAAASCEVAHANLVAGGVTGQPLTDIAAVQEQMTAAFRDLQGSLAKLEAAAAAAASLRNELESHRVVADAYTARPDAGSKEFNTTH